ncbi:MAG: autotransporter outer membrane beta-barrel domain-containing protein [Rickettsiales bacterium]|nr:autotransporter outer membrane beta-barrel domain-containing protein [Rickettsiales bacterium]
MKLKFIISSVALVVSIAAGAAEADTAVNVEHLEKGETRFSCRNRDISLTRTGKEELNYRNGNYSITLESIHVERGNSLFGFVLKNNFNVDASMTDEKLEEAMNVLCRNEPKEKDMSSSGQRTYSREDIIKRQDNLVSGQLYKTSAVAFRDLVRSAAADKKDSFYVEIGGSKTTSSSQFNFSNIILGFPKIRAFGNMRLLIGHHGFSDISFSESGTNYNSFSESSVDYKINHKLENMGIFSAGLYGRWSVFNDSLHADSFIYFGYYSFDFYAECEHVVEKPGESRKLKNNTESEPRNNSNFGIRLGFDYDIWINSSTALRPGLHAKFLRTGPSSDTTTISIYDFSEHQLGYELSLNFDFNLHSIKADLFAKYDGVLKNSNGEAEEKRYGSIELGANFSPASGKSGFSAGISYEFREKKDQSVIANVGYEF